MIHIAFNCSENYAEHLKVVIKSIKENTKEKCTFHIIGVENIDGCKCYKAPNIDMLHCKKEVWHITKEAFYRLFLPELVNENKIIYLDIDIVVLADIKGLWDIPCNYISACKDPLSQRHLTKLGIDKPHYINSGVILMNLEAIRKDKEYKNRIIEASKNPRLSLLDQDIINEACSIDLLPPEWNTYSKDYGQEYIENPKILHCCGADKFWNSEIRGFKEWSKYKELLNGDN